MEKQASSTLLKVRAGEYGETVPGLVLGVLCVMIARARRAPGAALFGLAPSNG